MRDRCGHGGSRRSDDGALRCASCCFLACDVRRPCGRCTCRRYSGGVVATFHAPFAARVTNGVILVMYLKGAPCALGGGGRYGWPRGHMHLKGRFQSICTRSLKAYLLAGLGFHTPAPLGLLVVWPFQKGQCYHSALIRGSVLLKSPRTGKKSIFARFRKIVIALAQLIQKRNT